MSAQIKDFDDLNFDPFETANEVFGVFGDIYKPLGEVRRKTPVYEGNYGRILGDPTYRSLADPGQREFIVLSYDAVAAASLDAETFVSGPVLENNRATAFGPTVSGMDPPVHGRYRKIFQAAFLPKTIKKWGDSIVEPIVNRLIDRLAAKPKADLVEDFTRHYPFEVIYQQLSLPPGAGRIFHKLAAALVFVRAGGEFRDRALEASAKLGEFFTAMIEERRSNPRDGDLVSLLVHAEVDGERLPDELVVSFLRQLTNAGGETTFMGSSTLLGALLTHPEQLEAIRADRSLIPQAIEEAVRWEAPAGFQPRQASRDTTLGGVHIPAGAHVELFMSAANHDETYFANPDEYDIFRPKIRHFGFGYGPHVCIGQHLARIEMTAALNAILNRLPNLRLDPSQPPPAATGVMNRHPRHIHVLFD